MDEMDERHAVTESSLVLRPPTAFEMLVSWPPRPLTSLVIVANEEVIPDSDAWTAATDDWTAASEDASV